jgi:hypothetical protein
VITEEHTPEGTRLTFVAPAEVTARIEAQLAPEDV